jgi:hypothetical protein
LGPIIGGAVGGLAGLLIIILVVVFVMRCRKNDAKDGEFPFCQLKTKVSLFIINFSLIISFF